MKWTCDICHTPFTTKGHLKLHIKSIHDDAQYNCDQCKASFNLLSNLKRHKNSVHNKDVFTCSQCDFTCSRKDSMKRHAMKKHPENNLHTSKRAIQDPPPPPHPKKACEVEPEPTKEIHHTSSIPAADGSTEKLAFQKRLGEGSGGRLGEV